MSEPAPKIDTTGMERIVHTPDWHMGEYGVDKCDAVGCTIRTPHIHKFGPDKQRREMTPIGKAFSSIGLLAFGLGLGAGVLQADWRYAVLGVIALITLLGIGSIFAKEKNVQGE